MSNHFRDSNIRAASPIVFKSGAPISVVCVAATYTVVTYANKGGKVQLSSAGVHSLTTSPAVGASVYVSWASGTGVSGLYKVLSVDDTLKFTIDLAYVVGLGTPTVAQTNANITVVSLNLPALTPTTKIKNCVASGFAASAAYKQIDVYINSLSFGNVGSTTQSSHTSLRNDGFFSFQGSSGPPYTMLVNGPAPSSGSSSINKTATTASLSGNVLGISFRLYAPNEAIRLDSYIIEVLI